jgi:hypothetical protein
MERTIVHRPSPTGTSEKKVVTVGDRSAWMVIESPEAIAKSFGAGGRTTAVASMTSPG